jgi:lipopolysaccharide transport system permease protein
MSEQTWDLIVDANDKGGRASFKKIWQYRDLLWLLVRRDFVAFYKQTILGPLWFFLKPVFSAVVYLFVFGKLAGLSTDGIPPALFYISGITAWSYFSETVGKTADVLRGNAAIFGKVYFPRLIMPLSIVFSNLLKLGIQLILIVVILTYYLITTDLVSLTPAILLLPVIVLVIAVQALGVGLFVAAISTKYRDISMLIGYVLQLGLFVAPVVYPLSSINGKFRLLVSVNPMSFPLELFRYSLFGTGTFSSQGILYMIVSTLIILLIGLYAFNKGEKTFVDTV